MQMEHYDMIFKIGRTRETDEDSREVLIKS